MRTSSAAMYIARRRLLSLPLLGALPALQGCGHTPAAGHPPRPPAPDPEALRWLLASADRHGRAAYRGLRDINVAYDGQWRPLIDRIQPEVVDKPWRQRSEERLLLAAGVIAQAHRGPGRCQAGVAAHGQRQ